jgi:hypothetical protein
LMSVFCANDGKHPERMKRAQRKSGTRLITFTS